MKYSIIRAAILTHKGKALRERTGDCAMLNKGWALYHDVSTKNFFKEPKLRFEIDPWTSLFLICRDALNLRNNNNQPTN